MIAWSQTRNPKSEIRQLRRRRTPVARCCSGNSKQVRNQPMIETLVPTRPRFGFWISVLRACFGFRASDFALSTSLVVLVLTMGLLCLSGCEKRSAAKSGQRPKGEGGAPVSVPVTVAPVEQRTTPITVSSFGTVEACAEVDSQGPGDRHPDAGALHGRPDGEERGTGSCRSIRVSRRPPSRWPRPTWEGPGPTEERRARGRPPDRIAAKGLCLPGRLRPSDDGRGDPAGGGQGR